MGTNIERTGVVAPCEAITDYPTYYRGEDAASLLAAWTAAWRPGLIAQTGKLPEVVSPYMLPEASDGAATLLLVSTPAESGEVTDWLSEVRAAAESEAAIVEGIVDRPDAIARMDSLLPNIPQATEELDREFFALGYAYQQCSQLTPDMHYGGIFQAELFREAAVAAARFAVAGDADTMLGSLATCYDQLEECRNHIYAVEPVLVDVLLVAETTLGQPLIEALQAEQPTNVLMSGKLLDRLAQRHPETLAAIKNAAEQDRICIATGNYYGEDVSTLAPESMHRLIRRGLDSFHQQLGITPQVFGQHALAAPPRLPQLLNEMGMKGALMVGFDGSEPLPLEMGRATWVGIDGTTLETVTGVPRDLAQPETMLRVAEWLQESLQRDFAAVIILAGWPGTRSPFYEDLKLVAKRSGVLGRFVKLDDLLETDTNNAHWSHVEMDALGPARAKAEVPVYAFNLSEQEELLAGLCKLSGACNERRSSDDTETREALVHLTDAFGVEVDGHSNARLDINPWSFARPAGSSNNVAIPPHGVALCLARTEKDQGPRVEGNVLRNERLELTVNPTTGGIQALRPHRVRRNFLSQRLVLLDSLQRPTECTMRLDSFEPLDCGPEVAAVESKGFLLNQAGELVARYKQEYRIAWGDDCATMGISIWPEEVPYLDLACEFRFGSPDEEFYRGLQWSRLPVDAARMAAFEYVQIGGSDSPLTIAASVTQWMLRTGDSQVAALLAPESHCRKWTYSYAIGIDNPYPMQTLLGGLAEIDSTPVVVTENSPSSAWWLHLGAANVLATYLNVPIDSPRTLQLRLIETEGRVGNATIRLPKPIQSARRTTFTGEAGTGETGTGEAGDTLKVVDGTLPLEIGPYGWIAIEVSW